jgi:hypothetical protein
MGASGDACLECVGATLRGGVSTQGSRVDEMGETTECRFALSLTLI